MKYMTGPRVNNNDPSDLYELIGYFRKAHELSPFHAAACGCLGYMLVAAEQADEARVVFEQAIEAKPLSPDLRADYAVYLAWAGRYEDALQNTDLALKLGPVSQDRAILWIVRSVIALAQGDDRKALDAINRAMFIRKDTFYTPAAVAVFYVLGQHDEAAKLYEHIQGLFPDVNPTSPVFYVTMKPIDDILMTRREQGETDGPADVTEIYSILGQDTKQ
jgi:tetratricopeptide (TPR) repeat protein